MPSPLGLVTPSKFNNYTQKEKLGAGPHNPSHDNDIKDVQRYSSIFNKNKFYYRPISGDNGKYNSRSVHGSGGSGTNGKDDVYNTTTSSIIDYTSGTSMELSEQDFAYLRDYGVYPNNRLIVARRFKSPVEDDLTNVIDHKPISTLISWFEGEKSPLKLSFGEKWENGQGNLIELMGTMLGGGMIGKGINALDSFFKKGVPFPGFSEGLQFQLLNELGVTDKGLQNVPSGNPNLIQESKKRGLVGDSGGSGMDTKIDIDFTTVYEQKFIGGNDPTLVYLDIINNVLRFGGSESNFYINGKGGDVMKDFVNKFRKGQWVQAMSVIVGNVIELMKKVVTKLFEAIKSVAGAVVEAVTDGPSALGGLVKDALSTIAGAVISKFRVQIGGVVSSLTGDSSTPWHVTIGNPKSPIFSTGDMYTTNVTIELGEVLAFNDLPSKITVTCTLSNARSLGIQEIFAKFNSGKGRSYENLALSVLESPISKDQIESSFTDFSGSGEGITSQTGKVQSAADKEAKENEDKTIEASKNSSTSEQTTSNVGTSTTN